MPPPLALSLKIKYPDIYNRYRKLKGPIKSSKLLKTRRSKNQLVQPAEEDTLEGSEIDYDNKLEMDYGAFGGDGQLSELDMGGMEGELPEGLAELASAGHEGLARALLHLPRGGLDENVGDASGAGEGHGQGVDGLQLSEDVLGIAGDVSGQPETAWEAMGV